MNRELIINVNPSEISIALCEDKVLVELGKEKSQTGFAVGDIYMGRVRKLMPGLNAAFVNVGHEKDAFIHYLDLGTHFRSFEKLTSSFKPGKRGLKVEGMKLQEPVEKEGKIGDILQVGDQIMVQIAKEAISTKGPRITAEISLAGRNVVLVPFSSKIYLSQKIRGAEDKKRLRRVASEVLPHNFGLIMRTAAVAAKDEDILQDIETLVERWRTLTRNIRRSEAPTLLLGEMSRANTIIRDTLNLSFSQIVVDDEAMYDNIREYVKSIDAGREHIVKLYKGKVPIYDNYDISKQIKSLFAKYVSLRRGAYLIIEHTEAMHVIDVNSGNRTKTDDNQEQTALDVNLAAATEVARQLRLRDLGGIVIVDFIDLHKAANRTLLYEHMVKLMSSDKAKHTVLPISKFGLMQITRQRVRPVAVEDVQEQCPTCQGTGKVQPSILIDQEIERKIAVLVEDKKMKHIELRVSPFVAAYLCKGLLSLRRRWSWRYKCKIEVTPDQSMGVIDVGYYGKDGVNLML